MTSYYKRTSRLLPVYEAILMLKNLPKEELAKSIRRTADAVLERNGFFRDMKYLGLQQVPYTHSKDGVPQKEAHYLFYEFNVEKKLVRDVWQDWKRDRDTIKYKLFPGKIGDTFNFDECTFEDEMKPVPYRPEVMTLVSMAKGYAKKHSTAKELHLFSPYFPFQR